MNAEFADAIDDSWHQRVLGRLDDLINDFLSHRADWQQQIGVATNYRIEMLAGVPVTAVNLRSQKTIELS